MFLSGMQQPKSWTTVKRENDRGRVSLLTFFSLKTLKNGVLRTILFRPNNIKISILIFHGCQIRSGDAWFFYVKRMKKITWCFCESWERSQLWWVGPNPNSKSSKFMSIPYHDSKHPFLRRTDTDEISSFDPKGKFNFLEIISDSSNTKTNFYRG